MDEAQAAVERHGDGHARFGDRVHVGGNDRDVQVQALGQRGVELRVARQNFRIKRGQRDVIIRQAHFAVGGEKGVHGVGIYDVATWELPRFCSHRS